MDYSPGRSPDASASDHATRRFDLRAASPVPTPLPRLRSVDLFRDGGNELLIEHRGEYYRLRLTRQDKLILNK